jgi:hypothetical protein
MRSRALQMEDEGQTPPRTPSTLLLSPGLSTFSFDEGTSIDEDNQIALHDEDVVGLIADVKRLAAKDLELQRQIEDLIKRQSQHPAKRLQAAIAQRKVHDVMQHTHTHTHTH